MKRRHLILATLVWLSTVGLSAQTEDGLYFTHAEGEREQVNVVCPTPDGRVWLGTSNGLYRSTGADAQLTKESGHRQLETNIQDITRDGDGRLWVKTIANERFIYDPASGRLDTEVYPRICARGLTLPYEFHVASDSEGRLWLYGNEHCYRVDDSLEPQVDIHVPGDTIDRILVGRRHIYLYAMHHLYVCSPDGRLELTLTDTPKTNRWPQLAEDGTGCLWVADTALVRWDIGKQERQVVEARCVARDLLYSGARKRLFVATGTRGLMVYDHSGSMVKQYSTNTLDTDPLRSNSVNAIGEDAKGNLWVGYAKHGLSVSQPHQLSFRPRHIPALAAVGTRDDILTLCCQTDGTVYLGTEAHGLFRMRRGGVETERPELAMRMGLEASVSALHADRRGSVWAGAMHGGLYEQSADGTIRHHLEGSSPISVASDKAGRVAVCLLGEGFRLRDGEGQPWRRVDLGDEWCMRVVIGPSGRFYVATTTGLRLVDYDGTVRPLTNDSTPRHHLTSNRIGSLYADSRELLWFTTEASVNELQMYDTQADTVYHFPLLATTDVSSIVEDASGNIWLGTSEGLAELFPLKAPGGTQWNVRICRPTERNATAAPYFNPAAVGRTPEGHLLFGTDNGFIVVHPEAVVTLPWEETVAPNHRRRRLLAGLGAAAIACVAAGIVGIRRKRRRGAASPSRRTVAKAEVSVAEVAMDPEWDKDFVEQVTKVIEANISDPDFSVEQLSQQMCMHRTNLYKRLMAETGQSPNQLIRQVRLEVARQYLTRSPLQVSEIAYRVGFGSPKIFARRFKEAYGMSPSAYQQQAAQAEG